MAPGEAALREAVQALTARVIRLERRLDALGLDTIPGPPAPAGDEGDRSPTALLDALADGLESLGFKG